MKNFKVFLLLILFNLSKNSILNHITLPNKYFNCIADYLTEDQCKAVSGEWKQFNSNDCEKKDFISKNDVIGICCNMKCLSGHGTIKLDLKENKICNFEHNAESFYGFKNYDSFNEEFMNRIGYNKENLSFKIFDNFTKDNVNINSVYCSFDSKENFLIGLSEVMDKKFDYSTGGGKKDGPSKGTSDEDKNLIGFDCNRLTMFLIDKISDYQFNFSYTSTEGLYNIAEMEGFNKSIDDIKIGDIIFNKDTNTSKIYHSGVFIGNDKKMHAGGHDSEIGIANAFYKKDNDILLAADFVNLKKKENINELGKNDKIESLNKGEENEILSNRTKILEPKSGFINYLKLNLVHMIILIFLAY